MFGHESKPSRIYSFGAKAPIENADLVDAQMHAAHRYQNRLIEIERNRREAVERAIAEIAPEIGQLDQRIAEAEEALETRRKEIAERNARARTRTATAADRAAIKTMRDDLKALYDERKALRKETFARTDVKERLAEIDEESSAIQKQARADSGLYWGTYLTIEQAMQGVRRGAPPKFRRWTGEGKLAVQLQGGMMIDDAFGMADQRLRIERIRMPNRTGRRADQRCIVHMRIGSHGRTPIWCAVPVELHRELPAESSIKWVYLLRRRTATHYEWRVQFVLSRDGWPRHDQATTGTVGVELGWRMVRDGLRVAVWRGDDGDGGELVIPEERLKRVAKCEDLQSIRDQHFNAIREKLVKWKQSASCPEWFTERAATLAQWRSTARLAALALHWRDNRFDGDEEIYHAVEAWRKKDRHLYDWQGHQRTGNARWRDNLYRNVAAELSRKYRTAILEKVNWAALARAPEPEDTESGRQHRMYRRHASVGRLAQILGERMAEVVRVDAKDTTHRCHLCGHVNAFDAANQIMHTCDGCGALWDQDANAAMNLLASGGVVA